MVTLVNNTQTAPPQRPSGYDKYQEPDTRIPPKSKPILDKVSVNGVTIPESDILAEAQHHPAETPGEALKAAAEALVVHQLVLQETKFLGIIGEARENDEGQMETNEEAAIRVLIEKEVEIPSPTEQECRRYYDNNRPRFSSTDLFEARHILLPAPPDDSSARQRSKAQAMDILSHLEAQPEEFSKLAHEFSACSSSEQGGNLGQISDGQTVAEFEAALREMSEGELCGKPIETPYGFHIIALDRRIPGKLLPFDSVREKIAAWLEAASWARAVSQYVGILAGKSTVTGVNLPGSDGRLVQ